VNPAAFLRYLDFRAQVENEIRLEQTLRRVADRRIAKRMGWLALAVFLLLALASVARAQSHSTNGRPLILWAPPPIIGMYTIDSARVDDSLPVIATADWPEFTSRVMIALRACTGLPGSMHGWTLRTVAAPLFGVSTWTKERGWHADDPYIGFTFPHVQRIYVVQAGLNSPRLIRHELLHALLSDSGIDPRHGTPVADAMFAKCSAELPR
jgi:hypothetical protein